MIFVMIDGDNFRAVDLRNGVRNALAIGASVDRCVPANNIARQRVFGLAMCVESPLPSVFAPSDFNCVRFHRPTL